MSYNFAAQSFHAKKLFSRLFSTEVRFSSKSANFAFLTHPLGALGATYAVHLRLIGKHIIDFLLVIIELFSLGVMAEALGAIIDWKSAFLKRVGYFGRKFEVEGDSLQQPTILRVRKLDASTFHHSVAR